jgi:hypothetical protein
MCGQLCAIFKQTAPLLLGCAAAWHLSWVKVVNLMTGDQAVFTCNAWMDPDRSECHSWVKLPADPDSQRGVEQNGSISSTGGQQLQLPRDDGSSCSVVSSQLVEVHGTAAAPAGFKFKRWMHVSRPGQPGYKITVVTSNIWGAGTAARVFLELVGELGSSGPSALLGSQLLMRGVVLFSCT